MLRAIKSLLASRVPHETRAIARVPCNAWNAHVLHERQTFACESLMNFVYEIHFACIQAT